MCLTGTLDRYVIVVLMTFLTGKEDSLHKVLTLEIVQYKSYNIELKTVLIHDIS